MEINVSTIETGNYKIQKVSLEGVREGGGVSITFRVRWLDGNYRGRV